MGKGKYWVYNQHAMANKIRFLMGISSIVTV